MPQVRNKEEGLALYVNNCAVQGIFQSEKGPLVRDVELLAVRLRPYYIPGDFSHVVTVYVQPISPTLADVCLYQHKW